MKTAEEMRGILTEKAVTDVEFRRQLVADPKNVVNREFGITIPDNINVVVHESDLSTFHVALPPEQVLNEEQLEAISAGLCCCGF